MSMKSSHKKTFFQKLISKEVKWIDFLLKTPLALRV
jgi:hypothetical protein